MLSGVLVALLSLRLSTNLVLALDTCGWHQKTSDIFDHPPCFLPIDDRVDDDPRAWTLWTHKPHCVKPELCIYTDARALGGRGISVIASPDAVAGSFNLLEHAIGAPFPNVSKAYPDNEPPFELRDVPGRGMGLIATQKIPKDSVIMVDTAVMLAAVGFLDGISHKQRQELLDRAANQLADPDVVYSLAQKGTSGAFPSLDVLLTNSFTVVVDGVEYMGLFPRVSLAANMSYCHRKRINHACNPNAFTYFSDMPLAMNVWTSADIKQGEEITISYADVELTREERQVELLNSWGFKCNCALCSEEPSATALSDERRKRIRDLKAAIHVLAEDGELEKAFTLSEIILALVEKEGLTGYNGNFYEVPAMLSYSIGAWEKAAKYLRLAQLDIERYGYIGSGGVKKAMILDQFLQSVLEQITGKI